MLVRFGDFVFDDGSHLLEKGGTPLHLSPKAFHLLDVLIAHRPSVVSKQEILDEVWSGQIVEEENVKNLIAEVRRVVGEDAIRTVHRIGYAFAAEITAVDDESEPVWYVTDGISTYPIRGSMLVGRSAKCDIHLRASSVSRVHARVASNGSTATIEDLSSRNGTFVDGRRIDEVTTLAEGNVVKIGSIVLTVMKDVSAAVTVDV